MSSMRFHKQRLAILVVASVGLLACFIPLGHVPLVWSLQGIQGARDVALGVFGMVVVLVLLGPRSREMRPPARIGSVVATCLLWAFCMFRIGALGIGLPSFDEDDPRGGAYFNKACAAGVMEACARLGACYWTGTCGVEVDGPRGLALHEKACDGGVMSACGQLGVCYEFGGCGLGRSGDRAVALYEKACSGGEASMCNNLGVCYDKGQCGLGQDRAHARRLYEKACKKGDGSACHNLDIMGK
jgi:uncharacterized protein